MIIFGGHCFNKGDSYSPDLKGYRSGAGEGLGGGGGGVAAVKGGVALDRPYFYTNKNQLII